MRVERRVFVYYHSLVVDKEAVHTLFGGGTVPSGGDDLTKSMLSAIFQRIDIDNSGDLTFEEFVEAAENYNEAANEWAEF